MRQFKIINGFDRMADALLLLRAACIKTSIAANAALFPLPMPTLADFGAVITAFEAAVLKAQGGGKQDVAVKNELRQTLITNLHLLGNYVLVAAGGNEVVATASGFSMNKVPAPRPPITSPQGLKLRGGASKGELKLSFRRVAAATGYQYGITPSPVTAESVWEVSMDTTAKKIFTGLLSATEYSCRVTALGNNAQAVQSGILSRVVL